MRACIPTVEAITPLLYLHKVLVLFSYGLVKSIIYKVYSSLEFPIYLLMASGWLHAQCRTNAARYKLYDTISHPEVGRINYRTDNMDLKIMPTISVYCWKRPERKDKERKNCTSKPGWRVYERWSAWGSHSLHPVSSGICRSIPVLLSDVGPSHQLPRRELDLTFFSCLIKFSNSVRILEYVRNLFSAQASWVLTT